MVYFQTKITNFWVNFLRAFEWKRLAVWNTLQAFGILYGHLVILVATWCISIRFGRVCQKSGNPEICNVHTEFVIFFFLFVKRTR
jgi:hypothetical protein